MELKSYQKQVLKDLQAFLDVVKTKPNLRESFASYWREQGVRMLDEDPSNGMQNYRPNLGEVPHVCIKVPTAGGKTFIACNAIKTIYDFLPSGVTQTVLWLVPSQTILEQTLKSLKDSSHFYRQAINRHFAHRVEVYSKDELLQGASFNATSVKENLNILVMSFDTFRSRAKSNRVIYRENSSLEHFFSTSSNTDFVSGDNDIDEYSLLNVIRLLNPICIIDESHRAESDLSVDMLKNVNPSFVLDLTATPRTNSNIISIISAAKLKAENMIKLPVIVYNHQNAENVISDALQLQHKLEVQEAAKSKEYIRPIVLFQAEPKTGGDTKTFEKIKATLIGLGIPAERIAIKTADINELKGVDLMSPDCPIRYIITVNALKEGWDCPFAYILATVANKSSKVDVEQILGRVLRLPYTRKHESSYLNMSYVFTCSNDFQSTLNNIVGALNKAGFSQSKDRSENNIIAYDTQDSAKATPLELFVEVAQKDTVIEAVERDFLETLAEVNIDTSFLTADASSQIVSNALKTFMDEAQKVYEEDAAKRNEAVFNDVAPELEKMVNIAKIQPEYQNLAVGISIPQFYMQVPNLSNLFDASENFEKILLDKESLKTRFSLATADIRVNFNPSEKDVYMVDAGDSNPRYTKMADTISNAFVSFISSLPEEKQKQRIAESIVQKMGKMPPFSDKDLVAYVLRILELDVFSPNDVVNLPNNYIAIENIKKYIQQKAELFAEQEFYKLIEQGKVFVENAFVFSPEVTPPSNETPIGKGLYEIEGAMNASEFEIVSKLAALENIVFWHRVPERKKWSFMINGHINHYPDFILYTQKGCVIVVEGKGAHLNNEDTQQKLRLGKQWASLASKTGREYRYFMIFDNEANLNGAHQLAEAIEIIKEL